MKAKTVFSEELNEDVQSLLKLLEKISPLSDICKLLDKHKIELKVIEFGKKPGWIPIRNLVRIIAYASLNQENINYIKINNMKTGCDYFYGDLELRNGESKIEGKYKWQWTAFPGAEHSFDRFTAFPNPIQIQQ